MPLDVIVVGAGVAGATAAAALARNSHTVTIYERAESTTEVGFAFRVTPNSDRCLKHLGIDTLAGGAVQANTARIFDYTGKLLREVGENRDTEQTKRGTSVFALRPQLTKQLLDKAEELGVTVKNGVKVVEIDTENTTILLEDGTTVSADLVIGADGIHSVVRPSVVDAAKYKPQATLEKNAFRFMVPQLTLREDPVLSQLFTDEFRLVTFSGEGKRVIAYPVDFDRQYNLVCIHPAHLSDDAVLHDDIGDDSTHDAVAYNKKVSVETVRQIYSNFDPRLQGLFDKADPNGFRIWKLQDLELPHWSLNCTLLIGDAAHAVLPFAFSGTSMAIEDATVLAEILSADVAIEDLPSRIQLFERTRRSRIERVREASVFHGSGAVGFDDMGKFLRWVTPYDAVQEGKQALEEHLKAQNLA